MTISLRLILWPIMAIAMSLQFASLCHAQTPVLGGLVEKGNYYNGYGAGYYGGYGRDYDPYGTNPSYYGYGVNNYSYSGYGNGPYGAGSGSEHEFLSSNRYRHGDEDYVYDRYHPRPPRYYPNYASPVYNPYRSWGYRY